MSDYKITIGEDNDGCGLVIGFVVFAIVLGLIISCCDGSGNNAGGGSNSSGNSANQGISKVEDDIPTTEINIPDRIALTDVYVFDDYSDVVNTIREGTAMDSYGMRYDGPYFCLTSLYRYNMGWEEAYTELVTGGEYMHLSGTYFMKADYDYYEMTFKVYADGELVYDSGVITRRTQAVSFDVCIQNAQTVRITAQASNIDDTLQGAHLYLVDAEVRK